ncbi:MAG: CRTAC1 family protein [Bacteroidota bacterium]
MLRRCIFLFFFAVSLGGISATDPKIKLIPADGQPEGTKRMAAILKAIADTADPAKVFFNNTKRAELINKQMAGSPFEKKVGAKANYAFELLQAGKTSQSIKQLESFLKSADSLKIDIGTKFYSLLGIAYMRKAEQENCCARHTPESCIIPIKGAGLHSLNEGSTKAIRIYEKILQKDSTDLQTRWLLNLAYMTQGKYPVAVPKKYLIPLKDSESGKGFAHWEDIAPALGMNEENMLGGACMEDFDKDGFLDVMVSSQGLNDELKFFHNKGDGTFENIAARAGLTGIVGGCNMVHTDYNNDGFMDVYIMRGGWLRAGGNIPNSLLKNNGDGTFEDVTIAAGLLSFHPCQTASWADFNNDGFLDLFVGNESDKGLRHPCEFFMNNKNGTFTNIAQKMNMDVVGFVKGVNWGDINNDGLPDLYCSMVDMKNKLFLNRGGTSVEDWKFEEIAGQAGVDEPYYSFPCWFFDYDNDGWQDLFVSGYNLDRLSLLAYDAANEYLGNKPLAATPKIYHNNKNNTFSDVSAALGFENRVCYSMGSNFGDLDNDGWLDFYLGTGSPDYRSIVPNRMFHSDSGTFFSEVTYGGGFGHIQKGHAVDFGDIDNDGDQDIFLQIGGAVEGDVFRNVLFQNPGNKNKWIILELEGTTCNKAAFGARIKINLTTSKGKSRDIYLTCGTGGSFGASSVQQEIGLGDAAQINTIEIIFPDRNPQPVIYKGAGCNQAYKIVQGQADIILKKLKPVSFKRNG